MNYDNHVIVVLFTLESIKYHDFAFDPEKMFSIKDSLLLGDKILLKKADFHSSIAAWRKYHTIKSGLTLSHLAVR